MIGRIFHYVEMNYENSSYLRNVIDINMYISRSSLLHFQLYLIETNSSRAIFILNSHPFQSQHDNQNHQLQTHNYNQEIFSAYLNLSPPCLTLQLE